MGNYTCINILFKLKKVKWPQEKKKKKVAESSQCSFHTKLWQTNLLKTNDKNYTAKHSEKKNEIMVLYGRGFIAHSKLFLK